MFRPYHVLHDNLATGKTLQNKSPFTILMLILQRYWTNDAYYRTGGPIFYFIGAEGPMDGCSDNYSWQYLWWGAAVGAKFVCIEHRYYGSSYPTK